LAVAAGIRIVSLAPALTEDLFAIGAGPNVVGVDAFSDRPAAARRLPHVGGMRDVNAEAVVALRPDIVVGIPYEAVHLADVARGGVRTEALPLDDLREDLRAIERLGMLSGHAAAAQRVVQRIRARLASLASAAARTRRLTAFVSLGGMGSAGGGSYVDELLGLANLHNVTGGVKRPW
jgi:ABC-type hemin transport system substrate-binding protein